MDVKNNDERKKWGRISRTLTKASITFILLCLLMVAWYWFITSSVSAFNVGKREEQYYLVLDDEIVSEISPELYHQLGFVFWLFPKMIIGFFLLIVVAWGPAWGLSYKSISKDEWDKIKKRSWEKPFKVMMAMSRYSRQGPQLVWILMIALFISIILYPIFFLPPPIEGSALGSDLTLSTNILELLFKIAEKEGIVWVLSVLIFTVIVIYAILFIWRTYKPLSFAELYLKAVEDET